jgi:hypothetical protein
LQRIRAIVGGWSSFVQRFSLKPEVLPFSGNDHPGIVISNHLGGALAIFGWAKLLAGIRHVS